MTINNVLVDQQSGFRFQHSTETTLLTGSSTNEWLYNMDRCKKQQHQIGTPKIKD